MNELPLHPALVHVPIGLAVAMPFVLGGLLIALLRGKVTRKSFAAAAGLQTIVVIGGIVAFVTGGVDEERVEAIVREALIERHETLAGVFLGVAVVVLLAAMAAWLSPVRWTKWLAGGATLASLLALGVGVLVGHAGGQLVYQHGAASAYALPSTAVAADAAGDER
jgi:uncharacterized membrane protein